MKYKYLLTLLLGFLGISAFGQVEITVPSSGDTVVCNGEPLTLHAINNGYHSHTVSLSIDDGYSALEPIGFSFKFYGNTYTNMVISSNGYVTFNASDANGYSDWDIPPSGGIHTNVNCENSVLGIYSDIYIPAGGTVTYGTAGVAPNRKCVINFCNCHMFSCTSQYCTFQIILYETSNIAEVHIAHKTVCSSWNSGAGIEGVENASATAGTPAPGRNYPGTWSVSVADGRRFTPDSAYTAYTCDTIPYAPIPDSTMPIYWYSGSTYEGMGPSITVNPTVPTTYEAWALTCGDTSKAYVSVTIGTGPTIGGFAPVNPSVCGFCDGSITLTGVSPSSSDTINYDFNGVPQPYVVVAVGADSTATVTGLCAGTYTNFTVKQGYCTSSPAGPVVLTNPPIFITSVTNTIPSVCGACDATITLFGLYPGASDTINYDLGGVPQTPVVATVASDGSVTLTGLCAGTYSNITATMNVCTTPIAGPVDIVNPPFVITDTSSTNASCLDGDATITLYGLTPGQTITVNYNYNGTPQPPVVLTSTAAGTVTLTGLFHGVYDNITATLNTCIAGPVGSFNITQPPVVPINVVSTSNPTQCGKCDGEIVIDGLPPYAIDSIFYTFTPTGGSTTTSVGPALAAIASDSTITLYSLCEGDYSNIYLKIGVCPTATIPGPVTLVAPPIIAGYDTIIHRGCNGDTVYFQNTSTPPAILHYSWSFGDGFSDTAASPLHIYQQGLYTPTLTITNGYCSEVDTNITLDLRHPLHVAFTANPIVCQGVTESFTNTTTGSLPIAYQWSFGDGTADTNASTSHIYANVGTYSVTLIGTNFIPCSDTARETISVDSASIISLSLTDTAICTGNSIAFSGVYTSIGSTGITWNFGDGDSISNINPVTYAYSTFGHFTITLNTYYRACGMVSATHDISVYPVPLINLGPDTSLCPGSTPLELVDNINGSNPLATWLWSTGATTPSIMVSTPGTYAATVYIDGCSATDSVIVLNSCFVDIPNIFSPNHDGVNDYFYPQQFLAKGVLSFKMDIFNRWGEKVFEGTSSNGRGWDGKFNNIDQPNGVYIYVIDATLQDGQTEHRTGNVTLLR